jgi:hypothetical protein
MLLLWVLMPCRFAVKLRYKCFKETDCLILGARSHGCGDDVLLSFDAV